MIRELRTLPASIATPTADAPVQVLLVEDSTADAELIADLLHDEVPGLQVTVVASLRAALPRLAEQVDVVITDLSLPDASGLQSLRCIRRARPDVPVVVMTGQADRAMALEAVAAGADHYLVKGVDDGRAIATAVLYAVQRQRSQQATDAYQQLALSLLDAMEYPTCAVDADGIVIAVNQAWESATIEGDGDPQRTGVGVNYFAVCRQAVGTDSSSAAAVAAGLAAVLAGDVPRFEHTYPCPSPSGNRWFSLRINPLPRATGAVLTHMDVSAAKQAEMALVHRSLHDPLTELPNRTLLGDRLTAALEATAADGRRAALAFVDLDQFKRINDTLGHRVGDDLLRQVAARVSAITQIGDTVARFAGDEFVVLWPSLTDPSAAEELVRRVRAVFDAPFDLAGRSIRVTASIGVVIGRHPQTADELLRAADAAMYAGKQDQRGGVRFYSEDIREVLDHRLRIEEELRQALVRDELVLHYQPVVDLRAGVVAGVEALLRWDHPDGMRQPDSFMDIAEASDLIIPLGAWILHAACRQAAEWAAAGHDLVMAVNLSARQVAHPDILATLDDALHRSGLAPDRLLVEVTESVLMEDTELSRVALTRMAAQGVRIAIDDFGTGYSSLVYLKRYPIHALKVDRSFVAGMGRDADDDAIVQSVVGLARAVGSECIAEGVETHGQLAALRLLGCDYGQGFLFSQPFAPQDLSRALARCDRVLREADRDDRGTAISDHAASTAHPTVMSARRRIDVEQQLGRALADLEASSELVQLLLESTGQGLYGVDIRGRCTFANRAAVRLLGFDDAEQLVGQPMHDLIHHTRADGTPYPAAECAVFTGLRDQAVVWRDDEVLVRRDGTVFPAEYRAEPVRRDGRIIGAVVAFSDITERRQFEQQLLTTQRMESLSTLAGGLAHTLNNVLTPIMMGTDLLAEDEVDERRLSILDMLRSNSRRGADVVRQILSFARGVDVQRTDVDLSQLLCDLARLLEETFLKAVKIDIQVPDGPLVLQGDLTQLHQVLVNLCVNARDAMPDGGTLQLTADITTIEADHAAGPDGVPPGQYVRIHVIDDGVGMPPEVRDRMFEPFFTTKPLSEGTGLGLSVSAGIIRSHGGFIDVDSAPGQGTRMSVHLPISAEACRGTAWMDQDVMPRGDGQVVLVVDDEPQIRRTTRMALEANGYRVVEAADGDEAVTVIQSGQQRVAAVMTDMMMPGRDGRWTIGALRRIAPDLPVIAASGLHSQVAPTAELGVTHVVTKPWTVTTLLTTVHRAIRESAAS